MIAALPMYDLPALVGPTDRLWTAVADACRRAGIDAPDHLTRGMDLWTLWQSPDLFLAQTCGLPYRARLHGHVTLVGTPDYRVPGCPPGHYRSAVIARQGSRVDGSAPIRLAYNDPLSQSGWAAALEWTAQEGVRIAGLLETGAHRASAEAVAAGRADLATVDAVTWRLLDQTGARPAGLVEIGWTAPRPGLPLITAAGRDPAPLAAAFEAGLAALAPEDRAALGLHGLVWIPPHSYTAIPIPPAPTAVAAESGM